eukprot:4152378-Prorocentrum_lima.AAC.1
MGLQKRNSFPSHTVDHPTSWSLGVDLLLSSRLLVAFNFRTRDAILVSSPSVSPARGCFNCASDRVCAR